MKKWPEFVWITDCNVWSFMVYERRLQRTVVAARSDIEDDGSTFEDRVQPFKT